MSYRQVTETLKRVAKEYQADMAYASSYIKKIGLDSKLRPLGTDARDFAPMISLLGIEGDSQEAREQDIEKKIHMLAEAFENPDHEARKPYLDKLFGLIDNFDPATVNMDDEMQVRQLLQCMMVNQTYAVKRNENLEHFNSRYSTPETLRLANAQNAYIGKVIGYVKANLHATLDEAGGLDARGKPKTFAIEPGVTIFSAVPYTDPSVYACGTAFTKMMRDKAREDLQTGAMPSDFYEVPILDSMIPFAQKKVTEILNYPKSEQSVFEGFGSFVIGDGLLERQNKNMEGLMEANLPYGTDAVYVDGMRFADFRKQHFSDQNASDTLNFNILTNLLLNGNHRLDIVHPYRDENGEMKYEPKMLRAVITPEQEKLHLEQYSWFRRTFFNWGPFRIEPLQEKMDRILADPKNTERHQRICTDLQGRVEAGIAKKQEEARREAQKDAEIQRNREAYQKETQRLHTSVENSVKNYGENSVIGILGQQAKNSYDDIMKGTILPVESARYEKMALPLAKQVLFTQLCLERVSQNGGIGPLEQSLMGNGTPEAMQEKIENLAQTMAKDPILKDVFFTMTGAAKGDYTKLDRSGVQQMIRNGGCTALTQAYNAQKMELSQNKQPTAVQKELTVQQEAPTNAPTNTLG